MAILFLPRQFQVAVIENINEDHLDKAIWLFPLYLLVINLFVLPIALAGLLRFPAGTVDADFMVLLLPLVEAAAPADAVHLPRRAVGRDRDGDRRDGRAQHDALQRPDHAGAAAPALAAPQPSAPDLSGLLLAIRRGSILGMLLLGYAYFKIVGESYALATMGLRVVLRRGPVRAADPVRHLLEGRDAARRADRAVAAAS